MNPKSPVWISTLAILMLLGSANFAEASQGIAIEETNKAPQPMLAANQTSTVIPLRQVAEDIGATVTWNHAQNSVTLKRGTHQWRLKPESHSTELNGRPIKMDKPAVLHKGTIYVSIGSFIKAMNADITWDEKTGIKVASSDIATRASYFMSLIMQGKTEQAGKMLSEDLSKAITETGFEELGKTYHAAYGRLGAIQKLSVNRSAIHQNANLEYTLPEGGELSVTVRFDHRGNVDDLFIASMLGENYEQPEYDNPESYTEQEVIVGEGTFALPGTLTVPKGKGPFPAVVLVHGSGPNDRDSSIGASKMFRDLAVGLAGHHIAVLRYEKRTREHALKSDSGFFTVKEETIDDALAAVKHLQQDPSIDAEKIFVLGHSQGGMLIPRILEQDKSSSIHGALIMAGPSQPLEDIMLWQYNHMLELARSTGAPREQVSGLEQQLAFFKTQLILLKDSSFSQYDGLPGFQLPHPEWWYDFRNFYAGDLARKQDVPMLIVQGDNDMQVSADNLEGWKQALAERNNVTFKLYSNLNHLFVPSESKSTGAEYFLPGNVPATVIQDVGGWIQSQL